ncbi:MAG: hypothetical protein PF795_15285 [Kiritimatiellae bacterium]|jgi:hypothetical protein|nr:hypothetical protein [Kiritimatiellia bacterium]
MKTLCIPFVFCLHLLLAGALFADEVPLVRTQLLIQAMNQPLNGLYFLSGDRVQELTASMTGLGMPIAYEGSQTLSLFKSREAVTADPPIPPTLTVQLPEDTDRILLLAFHPPEQELRLVAYPISSTGMKEGDYRFFNFSQFPLVLRLGEDYFNMERGQTVLRAQTDYDQDTKDLIIQIAAEHQERARLVYSSVLAHRNDQRNFIFLVPGTHSSMPVQVRLANDRLPPPPPPPEE